MKAICEGCDTLRFYPKGCPRDPHKCEDEDEAERQRRAEVDEKADKEAEGEGKG